MYKTVFFCMLSCYTLCSFSAARTDIHQLCFHLLDKQIRLHAQLIRETNECMLVQNYLIRFINEHAVPAYKESLLEAAHSTMQKLTVQQSKLLHEYNEAIINNIGKKWCYHNWQQTFSPVDVQQLRRVNQLIHTNIDNAQASRNDLRAYIYQQEQGVIDRPLKRQRYQ